MFKHFPVSLFTALLVAPFLLLPKYSIILFSITDLQILIFDTSVLPLLYFPNIKIRFVYCYIFSLLPKPRVFLYFFRVVCVFKINFQSCLKEIYSFLDFINIKIMPILIKPYKHPTEEKCSSYYQILRYQINLFSNFTLKNLRRYATLFLLRNLTGLNEVKFLCKCNGICENVSDPRPLKHITARSS